MRSKREFRVIGMGVRAMPVAALAITAVSGAIGAAAAQQAKDYQAVQPLVKTTTTVAGEPIVYPSGAAEISSLIVTVPPGAATGYHKHGAPTYGYILSGEITVDYEGGGKRTYRAGEAFMEAMDVWHEGINRGKAPCRILVVFIGSKSARNVIRD